MEKIYTGKKPMQSAQIPAKELFRGIVSKQNLSQKHILPEHSRVDRILFTVIDYIKESHLQPGDKLPTEKELCQTLGVGHRSCREALIKLSLLGLIESQQGKGSYLIDFDPMVAFAYMGSLLTHFGKADIYQIIQMRMIIEPMVAYFAAQCIENDVISQLEQGYKIMEENAQDEGVILFRQCDKEFHITLAKHCGNSLLDAISLLVGHFSNAVIWFRPVGNYSPVIQEHKHIIDALKQKDPERAKQAMEVHIQNAWEVLRADCKSGNQDIFKPIIKD